MGQFLENETQASNQPKNNKYPQHSMPRGTKKRKYFPWMLGATKAINSKSDEEKAWHALTDEAVVQLPQLIGETRLLQHGLHHVQAHVHHVVVVQHALDLQLSLSRLGARAGDR